MRVLILMCLGACGMGGPDHRGLPPQRVEVGGFAFDMRFAGGEAEVVRRGVVAPGRLRAVRGAAALAAERGTGCRAVTAEGDPAVLRVTMDCG